MGRLAARRSARLCQRHRKMQAALDWKPEIGVQAGITQLIEWVEQNRDVFQNFSEWKYSAASGHASLMESAGTPGDELTHALALWPIIPATRDEPAGRGHEGTRDGRGRVSSAPTCAAACSLTDMQSRSWTMNRTAGARTSRRALGTPLPM